MKELFGFLKWTWQSWQVWQKMFILAMFLQGLGWGMGGDYGIWVTGVGVAIVFGFMIKWFVLERIQENWTKYKQHRNSLLTTIKTSDERQRSI